jgi:UDPglucose 6-dehydrogenase
MRVGVIGTGHVGLVTCATLAALGHEVTGTDSDGEKVDALQTGWVPFFEPGLQELVVEQASAGRLSFSRKSATVTEGAQSVFICVGTPPRASGEASLVAVERAARDVAANATGRVAVVEKSTVPAGTARRIRSTLERETSRLDAELEVVSNPEFLREGRALQDSLEPDRILVGAESEWAFDIMRELYGTLIDKGVPLIETDIATAELAKHACNAFLALKISFANALARMCERAGADVVDVARVMGSDPRIGESFLSAGIGYGGYCFPKDLQAFERLAAKLGYDFPLLNEITRINHEAVEAAVAKVTDALWNLEDKRIVLLGLAFKPGTDDTRFAPALELARRLLDEGANVVGYDPQASANAKAEVPDLQIAEDLYDAATGAHCAVVCTEWDEIAGLDLLRLKEVMAYPVVVDGRNLFDVPAMEAAGFTYYPTGRPAIT